MRQLTIAERMMGGVLVLLCAVLVMQHLTAAAGFYVQFTSLIVIAGLAGTAVRALGRSIARPVAEVIDQIDAIARAEMNSAAPLPLIRGEIAQLQAATERLAEILGERQRRELVHDDLDRTWQAARRRNLSTLADHVEHATEVGIQPIVNGAATLQFKAEEMLTALDTVRLAFDETAGAAESSHTMNQAAGQLSGQVMQAIDDISAQVTARQRPRPGSRRARQCFAHDHRCACQGGGPDRRHRHGHQSDRRPNQFAGTERDH